MMTKIIDYTLAALLVLTGVVMAAGCSPSQRATGYASMTAIVNAVDDMRVRLPDICEEQVRKVIKEATTPDAATASANTVADRCDAALIAAEGVGRTAKTARDGIHDGAAGLWLLGAFNAYENLKNLAKTIGFDTSKFPEVK